jgi:hypothetical protein
VSERFPNELQKVILALIFSPYYVVADLKCISSALYRFSILMKGCLNPVSDKEAKERTLLFGAQQDTSC